MSILLISLTEALGQGELSDLGAKLGKILWRVPANKKATKVHKVSQSLDVFSP